VKLPLTSIFTATPTRQLGRVLTILLFGHDQRTTGVPRKRPALVAYIRRRLFADRQKPDELNRATKDVDAIGVSSTGNYVAIEHTSIDSFADQRGIAAGYRQFLNQLVESLPAPLPADRYFKLTVPLTLVRLLSRKERQTVTQLLPQWISANAPLLPEDHRIHFGFLYHGHQI